MNLDKERSNLISKRRRVPLVRRPVSQVVLGLGVALLLVLFSGCSSDDCVNCVEMPPPVVPTGVHSISGDNEIIVQWYDISYYPYDGQYNANVETYAVYSRFFQDGDQYDANREFYLIGDVAWNENFDPASGLHWFVDSEAVNGERYEYAVAAVNSNGSESALSYELVTDAPLPHSLDPVLLYDNSGDHPEWSAFDFSLMDFGRDSGNPAFHADIEVHFQSGVPYVRSMNSGVQLQDFGVFSDEDGQLIFEGVSWAPADGYSSTGVLELIPGHIYVVEIDQQGSGLHYAKLGVTAIGQDTVQFVWAYQTIAGLPELSIPDGNEKPANSPEIISL